MNPEWVLLAVRLLLVLVLYGFLAVVLLSLRRDYRSSHLVFEQVPPSRLLVKAAPETPSYHLLAELNEIGRAADNTVSIADETVSAHHARLSFQGGQWWLEDLGSRNGTSVNDILVEQPIVITYGDSIRFGRVCCRLEVYHAAAEEPKTVPVEKETVP